MTHAFGPFSDRAETPPAAEQLTAIEHDFWGPDVRAIQRIDSVPRILKTVCMLTGMGFATVARVTRESWICCAVRDEIGFGMKPGTELDLGSTLCKDICLTGQPIVIDEVAFDVNFASHPGPKLFRFQSNISVPIFQRDGTAFGTLCAIDTKPARVSRPEIVATLRLFADLIGSQLDLASSLAAAKSPANSNRPQDLRDQFLAVIDRNLHDPLRALAADAQALAQQPLPEAAAPVVDAIQTNIDRIARRVDDMRDFAKGRLGGGYSLKRHFSDALETELEQIVAAHRASSPSAIATHFDLREAVNCDARRIGQLLSNLVENAVAYGTPGAAVRVEATTADGIFTLAVENFGDPIADDTLSGLFQPFLRGRANERTAQVVGLGLYIASEIARAHGGEIVVDRAGPQTRFTFTMPVWFIRPTDG